MCKCRNIELGTYSNQTEVNRPEHMLINEKISSIGIDTCIVEEIQYLWSEGNFTITVEGNTNEAGSREGDGVYRKRRLKNQIYKISRWI